jgi:ABC-type lipoprotein release transport system permease subunit
MNGTLKLAWRSLWRNRRRTLISMSAAAIGLFLVILYNGMVQGILADAKNQLDTGGIGHVEVFARGYRERPHPSKTIPDAAVALERLSLPPGAELGSRVVASGLLTSARASDGVELRGVDWAREAKLASYVRKLVAGAVPAPDDRRGILIGQPLAEKLKVGVGSKVRLMVQRADGEMGADLFRVRGIFKAVSPSVSQRRVLVGAAAAESLLGVPGAAHQLVIQLADPSTAEAVAAEVGSALGPAVEAVSLRQRVPMMEKMEALQANALAVAAAFVYFLVGLGILNTALMSVLERTREFGVMMAVGTRPRRLVTLVLAESFWIATLSIAVGLGAGLLLTWYGSTHTLIDYSGSMGEGMDFGGMTMASAVRTHFSIPAGLKAASLVYLMALLVGLFPAWRVSRMHPAEALRRA